MSPKRAAPAIAARAARVRASRPSVRAAPPFASVTSTPAQCSVDPPGARHVEVVRQIDDIEAGSYDQSTVSRDWRPGVRLPGITWGVIDEA
jgi:hypothetical protein